MQNPTTLKQEDARGPVLTGVRAYLLATVCVGLALLLRWALDPIWKDRLPYASFFIAVIVVTQFADVGLTVFAMLAGFLLSDWFFVAPRHSLLISGTLNQLNAVLYFVLCYVVLYFSLRMRRAVARERAARMALGEIKALHGLLPICAHCKKIRDDAGYWNQIEHYISQHSSANFTHSICPECAKHHYDEFCQDAH
jgi:K+-sensing histidine kinase KdpD